MPKRDEMPEALMGIAINECDSLDITRVSEMVGGKWIATTIISNDEALRRIILAVAAHVAERCAEICNVEAMKHPLNSTGDNVARDCSEAIRAEFGEE